MDIDLIIIFAFALLLISLVFRFATNAHRRSVEHEERKLELIARAEEAKNGNGESGLPRNLEQRVRVLERIATDGNHALASEIEMLRIEDKDEEVS